MTRFPAAYARKSHKDQASAEAQLVAIREIARADGANGDLREYADVGISGRFGKRGLGSDWQTLLADVAADRVSTVYLSVLDRAGRSLEEWLAFTRLCVDHGTRVVDRSGERTREGFDLAVIEMLFADKEGRKAVERSARAKRTMEARGYAVGHPPYGYRVGWTGDPSSPRRTFEPNPDEPIQPLRDALAETGGSVLAAAKLLNSRGVLNRGKEWHPRSLQRVLDREGVTRLRYGQARRRAPSAAPLSKIVRCHCGHVMTPVRDRRTSEWTELYCAVGHRRGIAEHGRYVARSQPVMDLLKAEVRNGFTIDYDIGTRDTSGQRDTLKEQLRRIGKAYTAGAMDDTEFDEERTRIQSELDSIEDDGELIGGTGELIKDIDWDGDPARLGEALRQRVRHVQLGEDLQPVSVEFRHEAYRRGRVS